ncbi:hypothetical protein [Streptomyces sp. NBC_00887]|uniref:hypothetical protein n=1 Tax=Streptomyces sp. NBC_00887 TaxID=2975859 RepID=UPI003865D45D|nr:hypothetical protein OG844_28480 [Streptomyces sp. NBC_00887]
MGFTNFARKVRDSSLPYGHRVVSLRSCVQLYRPIGFEATVSYLAHKAGPFRTDEDSLLRALGVIEASRAAWQLELKAYAEERAEAKRRGLRTPGPREGNPNSPEYWYGARREAALHAVGHWRVRLRDAGLTDELGRAVDLCAADCLEAHGAAGERERARLAACADALERGMGPPAHRDDAATYFRHRDLLRVVRLIRMADEN